MFVKKLIIGLLSFYTFEIRRNSLKSELSPFAEITTEQVYESRKKEEKKKTQKYVNPKWKKKKLYINQTFKLQGTRPKDVRFSNQQKLRRMMRNS
jgi:hypothetical protein